MQRLGVAREWAKKTSSAHPYYGIIFLAEEKNGLIGPKIGSIGILDAS